ncbi:hypothetical protein [Pseudomonas sp. DR 5-09]|uniref:hypothetical protein n=1 Tax=Pseudomonas sp. DR 5-09 TaxID=1534110 RepID=UPI0007DDF6FD|nr:hypothetical protein [Pseudomonas sp. DR 5-09]ANI56088.1 hypothetical protein PDR5_43580 [Pseudomonas sp. DR 5-09]
MNAPDACVDFNNLINAPKFSDGTVGLYQKKRWRLLAEDIFQSTTIEALLEARGKAEGYIHGLVDAGHLSTKDYERDFLILCITQRRREFLRKLLNEYGY